MPSEREVEAAARKFAALKMGLSNEGEKLPDDLWRQAIQWVARSRYASGRS